MTADAETIETLLETQREILRILKNTSRAFPVNEYDEPDFDGHRKYHQSIITQATNSDSVKLEAVKKIVTWALIGFLTIIGYVALDYAKAYLSTTPAATRPK